MNSELLLLLVLPLGRLVLPLGRLLPVLGRERLLEREELALLDLDGDGLLELPFTAVDG